MSDQIPAQRERQLDDPITVTLKRREWLVILGAASDFNARVPLEQGGGGACLDTIRAALKEGS